MPIKKTLLSGLFWILLANLLVKPFWILGIEVGVQNAVGAEMYGLYFSIFSISYIFNILLDLGLTNYNTRNISRHPELVAEQLTTILTMKLLLFALYAVATFSAGLALGYSTLQFKLLLWLSINQFLNSMILYLRSNYEALLLFKWDSVLSVLDRVLMILICGAMLWSWHRGGFTFTILHFVYAQTAAYVITLAVALVVLLRKVPASKPVRTTPFSFSILRKSAPFALLVLLMASYNRIDPILLDKLSPDGLGDYNAGIYAGGFRILDALTMLAYLVSVPLLPVFARLTKHGGDGRSPAGGELQETTRMVCSLMTVYSVTAACALSSVADDLAAFFYRAHLDDYASVLRILVFCIIPISATYVFGTLLTAAGRLKELNIFAGITLAINIVINIICIPLWGVEGSAIAAVTAQSFMALAQIVAAIVLLKIQISWPYILKIAFFTLSLVVCMFCTRNLGWLATLATFAALALFMAFVLRLIDLRELLLLTRKQE